MKINFEFGPFSFGANSPASINGQSVRAWSLRYGAEQLAVHHIDAGAPRSAVIDAFRRDMASLINRFQRAGTPAPVLLQSAAGDTLASFLVAGGVIDGMTPSIPDDSSAHRLVTESAPRYSRRVTLSEFAELAVQHAVAPREWIQFALPDAVLSLDPAEWRAPTAWEIRHIVGEGSLTCISGAQAASLVGVTPQNFRKYTARDGAASRQSMSFAMWHLLLVRLGVRCI